MCTYLKQRQPRFGLSLAPAMACTSLLGPSSATTPPAARAPPPRRTPAAEQEPRWRQISRAVRLSQVTELDREREQREGRGRRRGRDSVHLGVATRLSEIDQQETRQGGAAAYDGSASSEQAEVRERVLGRYLPGWCAAQKTAVDASVLTPDWSFLTDGVARWFLAAIDQDVVAIVDGWPVLPDGRRTYLFEKPNGKAKLYREGFLEVAAAGVLAQRFGWPSELLSFQSPRTARASRPWAYDLIAYVDETRETVRIAAEIKWRDKDVLDLLKALQSCCERGPHNEETCPERRHSHHRKYQGLLDYEPRILWLVGPDEFEDEPRLIFRVRGTESGFVELTPAEASTLQA